MPPPALLINLADRPDRWRFQQRQARVHRLPIQRLDASNKAEGRAAFSDSSLPDGALGLWRSFERALTDEAPAEVDFFILLEDDVLLRPRFVSAVKRLLPRVPPEAMLVQLGYLGDSSWRPQKTVLENIAKVLRPRSRMRELRAPRHAGADEHLLPGKLRAGTHCLLIRRETAESLLGLFEAGHLPLDRQLVATALEHPTKLLRSRRNLAYQAPLGSDIPWSPIP